MRYHIKNFLSQRPLVLLALATLLVIMPIIVQSCSSNQISSSFPTPTEYSLIASKNTSSQTIKECLISSQFSRTVRRELARNSLYDFRQYYANRNGLHITFSQNVDDEKDRITMDDINTLDNLIEDREQYDNGDWNCCPMNPNTSEPECE